MRVGSVFSGIGGLDLGLEWVGFEIAWMCEIDSYARAILKKHYPNIPIHEDITQLVEVENVDVLAGGFPCQDVSNAGKRVGIDGKRSGLWREYARLIRVLRPAYVIVENVEALPRRGLNRVLGDLAVLRYDAEWQIIPASAVGAPHLRKRIFIVAYPHREGLEVGEVFGTNAGAQLQAIKRNSLVEGPYGQWVSEPGFSRMADGPLSQLDKDRIKVLGNMVVPQVAHFVGTCVKTHAIKAGIWK